RTLRRYLRYCLRELSVAHLVRRRPAVLEGGVVESPVPGIREEVLAPPTTMRVALVGDHVDIALIGHRLDVARRNLRLVLPGVEVVGQRFQVTQRDVVWLDLSPH